MRGRKRHGGRRANRGTPGLSRRALRLLKKAYGAMYASPAMWLARDLPDIIEGDSWAMARFDSGGGTMAEFERVIAEVRT